MSQQIKLIILDREGTIVPVASPCKEGSIDTTKTFGSTRKLVKSEALEPIEWMRLINAIDNSRDRLIVKLMLQGAKRIGEVLALTIDKVDIERIKHILNSSKQGEKIIGSPLTYLKI